MFFSEQAEMPKPAACPLFSKSFENEGGQAYGESIPDTGLQGSISGGG